MAPGDAPQVRQPLAPGPGAVVIAGQPCLGHLAGSLVDARSQFVGQTCHDAFLPGPHSEPSRTIIYAINKSRNYCAPARRGGDFD
jgi:hypothetical protein